MLITRVVGNIFVPPENFLDDSQAMTELLAVHREKKLLLRDLITGDASVDEMYEGLEAYFQLSSMDSYVQQTEQKLDKLADVMLIPD